VAKKIITIHPDGTAQFIHDDRLNGLLHQGESHIKRASFVEPGDPSKGQDPLKWYAGIVTGPVLGPFVTRQEALDAEVAWLNENLPTGVP
jgi:hypothetical protein